MKLYQDLDSLNVNTDSQNPTQTPGIQLKRGITPLEIIFARQQVPQRIGTVLAGEVKFVLKSLYLFDADPIAQVVGFVAPTLTGADIAYTVQFQSDTDLVRGLMFVDGNPTNDVKQIDCMAEILWRAVSTDEWIPGNTILVTLVNRVSQDGDVNPVGANDPALAPLVSPHLSGIPTAPTASLGTHTTQLSTTEFVYNALNGLIASAPGSLETLNDLATALNDDPNFGTWVVAQFALKANIDAQNFGAQCTVPTLTDPTDYSEVIANSLFVHNAILHYLGALPYADELTDHETRITTLESLSIDSRISGLESLDIASTFASMETEIAGKASAASVATLNSALSNYQAKHVNLTQFIALSMVGNHIPYFNTDGHMGTASFTAAGRAMVAAADEDAQKALLLLNNVTNDAQLKASDLDTDVTLAANSDSKVASQKAVKAYVDAQAGGGGSTISHASGTLTKIVPGSAATPAVETLYMSSIDTIFLGATVPANTLLTVNGTVNYIFYGFGGGNVDCGTQDPDTLVVTWVDAGTIMQGVADYINSQSWGVSAVKSPSGGSPDGAIVTVTTTATGSAATVTSAGNGSDGTWHAHTPGGDAIPETGVRQVQLAAAIGGKSHRVFGASFNAGAGLGWQIADAQIGYWDGGTFSPLKKVPIVLLTSGALGDALPESVANLITPPVGAALVARSAVAGSAADETTGDDLTLYVIYTSE